MVARGQRGPRAGHQPHAAAAHTYGGRAGCTFPGAPPLPTLPGVPDTAAGSAPAAASDERARRKQTG